MFDNQMRTLKERTFIPLARPLLAFPPWLFSLAGLGVGLAATIALWQQAYFAGFFLWFLNRVFDGLDGTVARQREEGSDLGGYLDIVFDFVVYAAIPVGLALGRPSSALYITLIFLLASFYVNAASWMYLAAILEKRRATQEGITSVNMPPGLIGGTETILFYTLFILFPGSLIPLFALMALLVAFTAGQRVWWALQTLA